MEVFGKVGVTIEATQGEARLCANWHPEPLRNGLVKQRGFIVLTSLLLAALALLAAVALALAAAAAWYWNDLPPLDKATGSANTTRTARSGPGTGWYWASTPVPILTPRTIGSPAGSTPTATPTADTGKIHSPTATMFP